MGTIIDGDRQDKFDVSIGELEKMLGGDLPAGPPGDQQKLAALDSVDWDNLLQEANLAVPASGAAPAEKQPAVPEMTVAQPREEASRLAAAAAPSAPSPVNGGSSAGSAELMPDDQLEELLASLDGTVREASAQLAPEPPAPKPEPEPEPLAELPPEPIVESVTELASPEVPSDDDLRSLLASLGDDGSELPGSGVATPPETGSVAAPAEAADDDVPPAWGAAEAQLPDEFPALAAPSETPGSELPDMDKLLAELPVLPEETPVAIGLPEPPEPVVVAELDRGISPLVEMAPEEEPAREPLAARAAAVDVAADDGTELPAINAEREMSVAPPAAPAEWGLQDDWQDGTAAPAPEMTVLPVVLPPVTPPPAKPVRAVSAPPPSAVTPAPVGLPPGKQVIACLKAGMYRDAVPILKSLIAAEPENADHYFNLSVACQRLHDLAGAQAALERCLEIDVNNYRALCNLAGMLYTQGDMPGAQELLERAVAINPFDSHSAYNLKLVRRKRSGITRQRKLARR